MPRRAASTQTCSSNVGAYERGHGSATLSWCSFCGGERSLQIQRAAARPRVRRKALVVRVHASRSCSCAGRACSAKRLPASQTLFRGVQGGRREAAARGEVHGDADLSTVVLGAQSLSSRRRLPGKCILWRLQCEIWPRRVAACLCVARRVAACLCVARCSGAGCATTVY